MAASRSSGGGMFPHFTSSARRSASYCSYSGKDIMGAQLRPLAELRNDPHRAVAAGHALDIVEGVAEGLGPVLPGGTRHVRGDGDVRRGVERMPGLSRLLLHHVEARARH